MQLKFRAPGDALPLSQLLSRALPLSARRWPREVVRRDDVCVDGSPAREAGLSVPGGALIEVALRDARETSWRTQRDEGLAELRACSWRVLVPRMPWQSGVLEAETAEDLGPIAFRCRAERGGVAELLLSTAARSASSVWAQLARAGHPVIGDVAGGGILLDDRVRICEALWSDEAETDGSESAAWWPTGAVFPQPQASELVTLSVSPQTARVLKAGHPWVLRDAESDSPDGLLPGSLVEVLAPEVGSIGLARIEGARRLAARMWALGVRRPRDAESVEARVAKALARRRSVLDPAPGTPETTALRLVHGEADGLPGMAIDRLGPILRVLVTGRASEGFRERAIDAVVGHLADRLGSDPAVVEMIHLPDAPSSTLECVRVARGQCPALEGASRGQRLRVQERGLSYWVESGLAEAQKSKPGTGLFLDQRENRERLAGYVRGKGTWLNLFAHTGAFSVSLLCAGASEVVSVDLSGPYLAWLEENLALNACDSSRHRSVRGDGRRYLETAASQRFEGIVLDPPTAAAAGRRFWSVKRDLGPLIESALARLAPGGVLFVSRNDRCAASALEQLIIAAADRGGVPLRELTPGSPGVDFPVHARFVEGLPHRSVFAVRQS